MKLNSLKLVIQTLLKKLERFLMGKTIVINLTFSM